MTKDQKIIKGKVGLLELAKQLGNVSQVCNSAARAAHPGRRDRIAERSHFGGDADLAKGRLL
jgi:hypothetical protein